VASPLGELPTMGTLALRALRRHPDRVAFVRSGRTTTYAAAADLVCRFQAVYAREGLTRGDVVGIPTANRPESWCAVMAAQASRIAVTSLHPYASVADQLNQLADAGVDAVLVDADRFAERGARLAGEPGRTPPVLGIGASDFGVDLLAQAHAIGASAPVDVADRATSSRSTTPAGRRGPRTSSGCTGPPWRWP
jgi:fatty-acyl-CoA synthase